MADSLKIVADRSNGFPPQFLEILNSDGSEKALAQFIVNQLLTDITGVEAKELETLRNKQASNEETILATFIGLKTFKAPTSLLQQVAAGETTWGSLLLTSGMKGREMVEEMKIIIAENKRNI